MSNELKKGTKVLIRPACYPLQVWRGEIVRKTPNGFSVRYEAFGVSSRETFRVSELTAISA